MVFTKRLARDTDLTQKVEFSTELSTDSLNRIELVSKVLVKRHKMHTDFSFFYTRNTVCSTQSDLSAVGRKL